MNLQDAINPAGREGKRLVITVHGVGSPAPGTTLYDLDTILPRQNGYTTEDLVCGGARYTRLKSSDAQAPDLVEVNWSDIRHSPNTAMGALQWLLRLGVGLSEVVFDKSPQLGRLWSARLLRFIVEGTFLWIAYPLILTLCHALFSTDSTSVLSCDVVLCLGMLYTLFYTWQWGGYFRIAGTAWCAVVAGLDVYLRLKPDRLDAVLATTARIFGSAEIAATAVLFLMGFEIALRLTGHKRLWRVGLARLAIGYLPFFLLSSLGSCQWALSLSVLRHFAPDNPIEGNDFVRIEKVIVDNLGFSLAPAELSMAIATACICFLMITGVVLYFSTLAPQRGAAAHSWITVMLVVTPLVLAIPGTLVLGTALGAFLHSTWIAAASQVVLGPNADSDMFRIYAYSATRIVPWLALAMSPAGIVLGIMGDVAFYIMPVASDNLSTRRRCQQRFHELVEHVSREYPSIVILAHSQGSVIAFDELVKSRFDANFTLITVGSPIGTLYEKYLQWLNGVNPSGFKWINLYHNGDYIGGRADHGAEDHSIGDGSHTDYWKDRRVAEVLESSLSSSGLSNAMGA